MLHDQENLEFLARQYHWLRQRGEDHDHAIEQLESNLDPLFHPLIARMASSRNGFSTSDPFVVDRLGELIRVVASVDGDADSRNSILVNALYLSDELRQLGKDIRDALLPRLSYIILIGVIGLIVSVIYTTYVFPNVGGYSRQAGATLITFSPLLELGRMGYPLIFIAFILVCVVMYLVCARSSYKLGGRKSFATPLHHLPGFSELNEAIKTHLHVRFLQLYARSGVGVEQGARLTDSLVQTKNVGMKSALHAAWTLDTLEAEMAYQQERSNKQVEMSLQKTISLWMNIFSIVAALTIAKMVLDFYAPLFGLAKQLT